MRGVYLIHLNRPRLEATLAVRGIVAKPLSAPWQAPQPAPDAAGLRLLRAWWPGLLLVELPARATAQDAVCALDEGADDAFPATTPDVLVAARLDALLRRAEAATLTLGPLVIDRVTRRVFRAGSALDLLPREYRLLLYFAEHPGQLLSRAALLRAVWGLAGDPGTNVLDVHLSRLRAKLDRPFAYPLIHTEKGQGFRLLTAPARTGCSCADADEALTVAAIVAAR